MSTFYVLPPRRILGARFAGYLGGIFPGLRWTTTAWNHLADTLTTTVIANQSDVYVVHREELPEGEDTAQALAIGFGAEPGDEVVEVRPGTRLGEMIVRRWRMGGSG